MFRAALLSCLLLLVSVPTRAAEPETWKAGVARVKITPAKPMWMSGYGGRTKPAEGTQHDLWAKALVLEDPAGRRVALVSMDLVGIPRDLSVAACAEITKKHGLSRESPPGCVHTPVSRWSAQSELVHVIGADQQKLVHEYAKELHNKLVGVIGNALNAMAPADIARGGARHLRSQPPDQQRRRTCQPCAEGRSRARAITRCRSLRPWQGRQARGGLRLRLPARPC
jgi:hypothetical protein